MSLILLLFVSISYGAINCLMMTGGRDALLTCFSTYVDTNHDNNITRAEASAFFANHTDLFPNFTDEIFRRCDYNHDDGLTIEDWNAPENYRCCNQNSNIFYVCQVCEHVGWTVPVHSSK